MKTFWVSIHHRNGAFRNAWVKARSYEAAERKLRLLEGESVAQMYEQLDLFAEVAA